MRFGLCNSNAVRCWLGPRLHGNGEMGFSRCRLGSHSADARMGGVFCHTKTGEKRTLNVKLSNALSKHSILMVIEGL